MRLVDSLPERETVEDRNTGRDELAGMVRLGGGCYGAAYRMADGWVLKRTHSTDSGCLAWLVWSWANQGKPGVPEMRRLDYTASGAFEVEMREYESMAKGTDNNELAIPVLVRERNWGEGGDGEYHEVYKSALGVYPSRQQLWGKDAAAVETLERFEREVLENDDTQDHDDGNGLSRCNDVHHNNVMWCPKRGMIVTDPMSSDVGTCLKTIYKRALMSA